MAYLSKKSADESRAKVAMVAGVFMVCGALTAWGFGASLCAAGVWLLSITICEAVTEELKK